MVSPKGAEATRQNRILALAWAIEKPLDMVAEIPFVHHPIVFSAVVHHVDSRCMLLPYKDLGIALSAAPATTWWKGWCTKAGSMEQGARRTEP
jgi:hypothetical protein